jgi:hypothetical protein
MDRLRGSGRLGLEKAPLAQGAWHLRCLDFSHRYSTILLRLDVVLGRISRVKLNRRLGASLCERDGQALVKTPWEDWASTGGKSERVPQDPKQNCKEHDEGELLW